jgi:signal transduction histidine kinase
MSLWSRQSIAVKLPIAFAVVLLVLGAAMTLVSYLEMRRTVIGIASLRLEQAAAQMATVLGTSGRQRVAAMQQLMRQPDVVAFMQTREPALAGQIEKAIQKYLGTAIAIANVEVWDASGVRLLAAGAPFDETAAASRAAYLQELQSRDAAIGRLRLEGDVLVYPVGGRVEANGVPLGFIVERRRIANPSQSQQTVALLSGLIGSAATIVVGNDNGSAWTNLSSAVTGVPITRDATDRLLEYDRPGTPRLLAWAKPIATTPWIVAIEFPRDAVMAPADRLVRRASVMAVALLLIAVGIGWAYSRRITTPLRRVTEAAEAAAELRHVAPIEVNRDDEIGRLADSFNVMTERVEEARHDLERRVEERTAELTAVNRELESFSYSVSHDLRAPLRAIVGFVQILEEDHAASLDPDARKSLERVKANAMRMGQLIDDLLTFARIGRTPLTPHRVDLNHLARTVADEAIATADHPVELVIEPLPPCVGEPVLLKQVLANLISNAVKFTARTQAATVTIGATTDGETTYFVRDNGAGFDERFAEKLFGVFQRLHRTQEFEGTGVGLAIVQRIINRHGGRVWAEGRVNAGATFYFTLPAAAVSDSGKHRIAAHT